MYDYDDEEEESNFYDDRDRRRKRLDRKKKDKQPNIGFDIKPRHPRFVNRRPRTKKWDELAFEEELGFNVDEELND